jgi:glucose-1-phosphate adenylyltransferase
VGAAVQKLERPIHFYEKSGDAMTPLKLTETAAERLLGDTLALALAGGRGQRLGPLTAHRPKAAIPFAGHYRAVDFALSNCVNSEIRHIALLTQYKSQALIRHVQGGWGFLHGALGEFIDIWPAQQHRGERWYTGPVDAVQQNLELIEETGARYVLVLAGDQIYSMDYSALIDEHIARQAAVTVACATVRSVDADDLMLVTAGPNGRIERMVPGARSSDLARRAGRGTALAAMGVYVFDAELLLERLAAGNYDAEADLDFAADLLPSLVPGTRVFAHRFTKASGGPGYWCTLDTIDRYWQAHMELLDDPLRIDLSSRSWPLFTHRGSVGPTQINAAATVHSSIIGTGCNVSGELNRSALSSRCVVGQHSVVKNSVLMPGARIGEHCIIEDAIVDSRCEVPDGTVLRADGCNGGYYVTPGGIVLVSTPQTSSEPRPIAARRKVA